MTPETKTTWIWTVGSLAAIVIVLVALWAVGVFEKPPAEM